MSKIKAPFSIRLRVALKGIAKVALEPVNMILIPIMTFVFSGASVWIINFSFLKFIAFDLNVSILEKLKLLFDVHTSVFTGYRFIDSFSIVFLNLLFSIIVLMAIAIWRDGKRKNISAKSAGTGATLGVLSAGCAACGTSILAPLLTTIGVTSTSSALKFGLYLNWIGIIFLIYAVYKIGQVAAGIQKEIK